MCDTTDKPGGKLLYCALLRQETREGIKAPSSDCGRAVDTKACRYKNWLKPLRISPAASWPASWRLLHAIVLTSVRSLKEAPSTRA